jgi:predicted phosphodiesterase
MIYLIGDTHGEIDHKKLNNEIVFKACGGEFPDYVIVLGDFGFIWKTQAGHPNEMYWLSWLESKPWITLFIDGNHENFERLNKLPEVSMFDSVVGQVSDRIFHLKRGNVYTIEDKKFFCMGGGLSIDKNERTPCITWWPDEIPSYQDFFNGMKNLDKHGYKVDYVLTHTCSYDIISKGFGNPDKYNDPTCLMLSSFQHILSFKKWFFGHMHDDITIDKKYICSYNIGHIV